MNLSKKSGILLLAVVLLVLVSAAAIISRKAAGGTGNPAAKSQKGENQPVELFVLAPCESCHEEDKFSQEVISQLGEAGFENPDCTVYNVYKDSGASHFEKTVEEYRLGITLTDLPAAVVQGAVYRGTYQEIGEAVTQHLQTGAAYDGTDPASGFETGNRVSAGNTVSAGSDPVADSAFYREIRKAGANDMVLVLFVTGACESCQKAEEYLQECLSDETFELLIYNILEDENAAVLRRLIKLYGVPESGQQVPLLFSRKGYLSGAEAILKGTAGVLESKEAQGTWEEIVSSFLQEKDSIKISRPQLVVTGFFNGLNPCGISMLLMVLSILLMSGRSFYGGSFVYLTGKFFTYLLLGFTIGALFSAIESTVFRTVQKGIEVVFAVLAFSFGVFYLMDFIHVLRKEYGRERLRLPARFRKWNHTMIKKLTKIPERFWYPVLFFWGILISAGEFLCTGQVYLASLLYMVEQNGGFNMELAGNLVLYLTAMCVPMVLLVVLVSKGKSVMSASHLALKMLPVVKLAYCIFFFALFLSLLF